MAGNVRRPSRRLFPAKADNVSASNAGVVERAQLGSLDVGRPSSNSIFLWKRTRHLFVANALILVAGAIGNSAMAQPWPITGFAPTGDGSTVYFGARLSLHGVAGEDIYSVNGDGVRPFRGHLFKPLLPE